MLKNYLKTAWRNLLRYPGYSFLNILGLSLGISASFVLFLFVNEEKSYDKHYDSSENIYRIASDFYTMGGFARTSEAFYRWMKEECKEAKYVTAVRPVKNKIPLKINDELYEEGGGLYVDSSFFKVFSFELLEGNRNSLLKNANQIVLSESIAKKFFASTHEAMGQLITLDTEEKKLYKVAGVVKDDTRKTHLRTAFFLPIELSGKNNWTSASIFVYTQLHDQSSIAQLEESLEAMKRDKIYPTFKNETSYESWSTGGRRIEYFVEPLHDIYLHSNYQFDMTPGGNPQQVSILGVIGVFLILIAIFNYINLTTARSSIRAKEVGVKKTLGAGRRFLAGQFLVESIMTSFIAMIVAGGLSELLLTVFQQITGQQIINSLFSNTFYLLALGIFSIITGLLAGIYPAFYLTKFKPVKILKGQFSLSGNKNLRGGLVIFQFTIAVGLIISSLIVFRQLQHMQEVDKGFEQEGVLILTNTKELGDQANAFKQEIERLPEIQATSFNDRMPGGNYLWMYTFKTKAMEEAITVQTFPADENYIPTLGLRLKEGRNFSKELASDSTAVILNQAAVEALGLKGKDPIGEILNKDQRVVGVVQNFNFQSLKEEIEPVAMTFGASGFRMAVKLKGMEMKKVLNQLEGIWNQFSSQEPLKYTFLDDNFEALAEKERMLGQAVAIFTILAIFIACLGLFGLAAFMAEQRTKEIGIRKVLGASISSIVGLLSKDFLRLVVIALIIATPLTYYLMDQWLQDFAYRISIQWWVFVLAGGGSILIAFVTMSFQSIKAALANPVNSLRSE